MIFGVLTHTVEVRALAVREIAINGMLSVTRMPRLKDLIVSACEPAKVSTRFYRDEEGRFVLDLAVMFSVSVACQRCLGPVLIELDSCSQLAVIWCDEQAESLPPRYDPLVTGTETDLWQLVEDELLLALPAFSYHDDVFCGAKTGYQQVSSDEGFLGKTAVEKRSPFDVLATLKDGGVKVE